MPPPSCKGRACADIQAACYNINYLMSVYAKHTTKDVALNSPANPLTTSFRASKFRCQEAQPNRTQVADIY